MSKKQKMKMLAAVLAAGSLYINSGTAFAAIGYNPFPDELPSWQGVTQESTSDGKDVDGKITIVIDDMEKNSDGSYVFKEENNTSDRITPDKIDKLQQHVSFSAEEGTTNGSQEDDSKLVISSLESIKPVYEDGKGYVLKYYPSSEGEKPDPSLGEYVYCNKGEDGNYIFTDKDGNPVSPEMIRENYAPVYDVEMKEHSLNLGSKVRITADDESENLATHINVNGEEFDLTPVKFSTEYTAGGEGESGSDTPKGYWKVTDVASGVTYENTTLKKVNTSKTEDGYGIDYTIFDTSGNELALKGAASADKLEDVDKSAVKYDPIYDKQGNIIGYDYSKITLGGDAYNNKRGGTELTNVAYAGNIRDESGKVLGSAAVNVDYLNDQLDIAKAEVTKNDQHLNYNKDYAVDRDKNEVKLEVVDNQGNLVGETVIKDVASATDVGDITEIHNDLKNEDGSETSVVDAVNNLDDKVGDLNYKHDDNSNLNYVTAGDSVTEAIGDLDTAINNAAAEAGKHTSVSGSDNISVTQSDELNSNGGVNYEVSLKDDITLGDKDGNNVHLDGDNGNISATGSISAGNITINGVDEDGKTSGTIGGLSNTKWDWNKYNNNEYENSSNAATEGQLHGAMQGTVQYDRNEDGSIDKGNITLGGEEGTSIHNVAPGRVEQGSMDAVNGGQLYDMQQNMGNRINNLDNRISKVGAGAAALAALHPLDFDPDDKLSFAVGYGNYRGENAAAVGAFYQPNEDTLFSLGGTVGNDENMVNVGVSFKLGQKNHVSNNRVSMAKEIISLRDKVAKLEALMI